MKSFGSEGRVEQQFYRRHAITVTKELFIRFSPISNKPYVQKKSFTAKEKRIELEKEKKKIYQSGKVLVDEILVDRKFQTRAW